MDKRAQARQRYIESSIGQRELAEEMGVHYTTVARWSKEDDWPSARKQYASKMQAAAEQAIERAVGEEKVQEAAKQLADHLEKYKKALDFTLGLAIKGLREPGLKFKDLGQAAGAIAKLVQTSVQLSGVRDDATEDIPDELRALAVSGAVEQPAPVFTAPGADENPREP